MKELTALHKRVLGLIKGAVKLNRI